MNGMIKRTSTERSNLGRTVAWVVLGLSGLVAWVVKAFFAAAFPLSPLGFVFAFLVFALGALVAGLIAWLGRGWGKTQTQSQEARLFELARQRSGVLTALETSRALGLNFEEAEQLLTSLTNRGDGQVMMEVTADGIVQYAFQAYRPWTNRLRVAPQSAEAFLPLPEPETEEQRRKLVS
jgi:hypothetical protein